MTKKTFKLYDVGVWLSRGVSKGGGAGEAIAPSLFGRIEGAALLLVLLLAPPPLLGSHLRP